MKNLRAYHFLKENGVTVSFDSLGRRTHAKLLVIDHETVILGSTNWSHEAIDQNYEANALIHSSPFAQEILEEFKGVELLQPEKIRAAAGSARIARNFLLDKNQGPRFVDDHAERALRVYLILLSKERLGPVLTLNYEEVAKLLGLAPSVSREAYRRQIIKVLKKLDRRYGLLRFDPKHGKEAGVTLLAPAPEENYFELPREFLGIDWLTRLSLKAQYSLLILYDQASYPRTSPAIEVALETLGKRYSLSPKTLGQGFQELARQNLLEIHYGRTIDFQKKEFETAAYVLLPFYDPKQRGEEMENLAALYGRENFEKARGWARAFFKENDPAVIQTLLGLTLTYSPEWVERAMKEVILKKQVGNPARSLPYLIGILQHWKNRESIDKDHSKAAISSAKFI